HFGKKLRQDSKYVAAAGITYTWLEGSALTEEHLRFFYQCYEKTYEEHWSRPYLSWEFFLRSHLDRTLHFVLVLGARDGVPVASALNVKGDGMLYGRYWGSMEFVKGLHFETCYLQAIRYCIGNGIQVFEGGAQGEHKMSRGLMPVRTFSAHHVQNRSFAVAIEDFLQKETASVEGYVSELTASSPFRHS
ncbi:MAG: GNAT family N-acetyltransferase, partial [Alcaligenaceae bacterium]